MKLTGTWLGEYTYGDAYRTVAGKSVPFTMSLTESWLGRTIGYVRDDASKGGQPERGRIAGTRRGTAIRFVKTMPTSYMFDADGKSVEKRAWLRRTFGIEQPQLPPHRIHYTGTLSADGNAVTGTWRIRPTAIARDEAGVHLTGGEGTWSARRIADLPSEV